MPDDLDRPQRKGERRSGRDRRSGRVRKGDRRKVSVPVAVERRSGTDRRQGDRREKHPRRIVPDRRKRGASAAPAAASRLTSRDRDRARRLPEDVAGGAGTLEQRLQRITRQAWPNFPLPVRAGLIEALRSVLEPVVRGEAITDKLRRRCEEVVAEWIGKYR